MQGFANVWGRVDFLIFTAGLRSGAATRPIRTLRRILSATAVRLPFAPRLEERPPNPRRTRTATAQSAAILPQVPEGEHRCRLPELIREEIQAYKKLVLCDCPNPKTPAAQCQFAG